MKKILMIFTLVLAFSLMLTACGSSAEEASADVSTDQDTLSEAVAEVREEPLQADEQVEAEESDAGADTEFGAGNPNTGTQLALLTFALENTDLAVASEQAAKLLPLWKSVQEQIAVETTDTESLAALFEQIAAAMSDEQLAQLSNLNSEPQAMQELLASLGIEAGMGPGGGAGGPGGQGEAPGREPGGEMTEEQIATMQAERQDMAGRGMFGQLQMLLEPLIELLQSRSA
jgi:predicted small secreted protein